MDTIHESWKAEVARRKLFEDTRLFWLFMAAQLELHNGFHIEKLTNIADVTSYLQDYLKYVKRPIMGIIITHN